MTVVTLKRVHEFLQIGLEIAGILLVAAGLGAAAAYWCSWAGGLIVSGATVLTAAYLGERRLNPPVHKPAAPPPVTQSREELEARSMVIAQTWGRLAWLHKN